MTRERPSLTEPPAPRHRGCHHGRQRPLGRKQRHKPRVFGHRAGVRAARAVVRACHRHGVQVLTLFAFSQENWQRPPAEVSLLMELFVRTLAREIGELHKNRVQVRCIGDHSGFPPVLRKMIRKAEVRTAGNDGLVLLVAAGYGGRWDIVRAAERLKVEGVPLTAPNLEARLTASDLPHPDLLIRTGGERRLSNFLLWQLAYSELYFTDTLLPDFDGAAFDQALAWYAGRERRFGRVPESA